jgi:1-acyl-sn-glycerol-3-phosphate acyltransferase
VWSARFRLACLWLSQVARLAADNCLRVFVVLQLAQAVASGRESGWHLTTALLTLPMVVLCPFNGALSNSLPKPLLLVATSLYCAGVIAVVGAGYGAWVSCWALVALGAAVYSPTRYALLPAASEDSGVPLTRVNGFIEMGAVTAVVGGLALGAHLEEWLWWGLPAAVVLALVLNLLGALAALPVRFAADLRRPDPAAAAVVGFFRDTRRILADREARWTLLALASLRGLGVGMMGGVLALTWQEASFTLAHLIEVGVWITVGIAAGSLLAGLQRHPRRALGLVPVGCTGLLVGLVAAAAGAVPSPFLCVVLGSMAGLVNVPLAATYQASLPADARGNGMAVRNLADYVFMAVVAGGLYTLARLEVISPAGQLWLLAGLAAGITVLSWRVLFRPFMEQVLEWLIWPIYRIHARGPGLEGLPRRGPLLIVANHSSWFDPLWLGKVIPRRITPMMTSLFYDLPGLRWLMRYVVQAIRVQHSRFRREAPELREAIAALDRGQCVVLFPEGAMRRTADKPLRQFGQGIWIILKERPQTPVVVCWIEGGWGSYCSYYNGPPTKNKRMDFWRRIEIAVGPPKVVDPALLDDQRATRAYLMAVCLETRQYLGLEEIAVEAVEPAEDDGVTG